MSLEIDNLIFCLKSMRDPDYEPLVRNKREIEMLQEKIALKNTQLITERKRKEKITNENTQLIMITERERKEKIINEIQEGTLNN